MNLLKATGAAMNLPEIFVNFPNKKLDMSCKDCVAITGDKHRDRLAQRIFKENFKLVINDVIDNNVTFQMFTGTRSFDIHMDTVKGTMFKRLRKLGKWKNIDILKSLFTANQLGFFMYSPKRTPRVKHIYVNRALRDKIDENTNAGKTYC